MDMLKAEEDKLDLESEETHGDYKKMKLVFEKRIKLYAISNLIMENINSIHNY